jgi:hypothetical protein
MNPAFVVSVSFPETPEMAPSQPFGKIRTGLLRTQAFLEEVKDCYLRTIWAPFSPTVQEVLRAARARQPKALTYALSEALMNGDTAQEVESALRHADLDYWLIGVKKDLSTLHTSWTPEEEPILVIAMNFYESMLMTVFKDPGSYTANFERIARAWPIPCDCHPNRPAKK